MIFSGRIFSLILIKYNIVAGDREIHCNILVGHNISLLSPMVNLIPLDVGQEGQVALQLSDCSSMLQKLCTKWDFKVIII